MVTIQNNAPCEWPLCDEKATGVFQGHGYCLEHLIAAKEDGPEVEP